MKTITVCLVLLLTAAYSACAQSPAPVPAGPSTNTLILSGAVFDNGSTLDGTFTYSYDTTYFTLDTLLSADLTVGGSTNLTGMEYIFNVPRQTDTATLTPLHPGPGAPASAHPAPGGDPGQNVYLYSLSDSSSLELGLYLNPIFMSGAEVNDSSGNLAGSVGTLPGIASGSSSGSLGTITEAPEPSTLALAGLGAASLLAFHRKYNKNK